MNPAKLKNTTTQQYAHDLENANKQDSIHQYRIIKRQAENNSEHPQTARLQKKRRGSPSLVWGRPAKSVVERPRGFESHTPRLTPFSKSAFNIYYLGK